MYILLKLSTLLYKLFDISYNTADVCISIILSTKFSLFSCFREYIMDETKWKMGKNKKSSVNPEFIQSIKQLDID